MNIDKIAPADPKINTILICCGSKKSLSTSTWNAKSRPIKNPGTNRIIQKRLNLETNVFFNFSNSISILELVHHKISTMYKVN